MPHKPEPGDKVGNDTSQTPHKLHVHCTMFLNGLPQNLQNETTERCRAATIINSQTLHKIAPQSFEIKDTCICQHQHGKPKTGWNFCCAKVVHKDVEKWCAGPFGTPNKFEMTRNGENFLDCNCVICSKTLSLVNVGRSLVNVGLSVFRKTSNGKKTAKDDPITITHWNICDCEMTVANTTTDALPSAGQIFGTREEFTSSLKKHCIANRKLMFLSNDSGKKLQEAVQELDALAEWCLS